MESTGRTIGLRGVRLSDYGALYELAMSKAVTWRNLVQSVAPEQFPAFLWDTVYTQRAVHLRADVERCVGLVAIINADLANGVGYLSLLIDRDRAPATAGGEAALLLVHEVFTHGPFRKIYAETSPLSFPLLAGAVTLPIVHEEARLRDHLVIGGATHDLVILSIDRDELARRGSRMFHFLAADQRVRTGSATAPPSFATFCELIAAEFPFLALATNGDWSVVLDGGASLADDLHIDSLVLLEVVAWIESTFALAIPDEHLVRLRTLQDLFSLVDGDPHVRPFRRAARRDGPP